MNNETKTEILGAIKYDYIASAAQKRMEFLNTLRRTEKKPIMKYIAALAACFVIVLAISISALIKNASETPIEYQYLDDLPTRRVDKWLCVDNYVNGADAPNILGCQERLLTDEELEELIDVSKIPMPYDSDIEFLRFEAKGIYYPSGELHSVMFRWMFEIGSIDVHVVLLDKTNEFTVEKTDVYDVFGKKEMIVIKMDHQKRKVKFTSDVYHEELLEEVYNYIISVKFDFKAIS